MLGLVDSPSVFLSSEFAAAVLGAVLSLVLAAVFIYAYMRCLRFVRFTLKVYHAGQT
jgi:uncharacterized protein (DUF58 family)